jgi:hypothetical protein
MARGLALLVGLTNVNPALYGGWDGTSGAKGCELDVDNMQQIISGVGEYKFNILKTQQATALEILAGIESAATLLKYGDLFVFYFSGHGGRLPDKSSDEADRMDDTLITYDRQIMCNELAKRWLTFAPGVRIAMLSDSCNSGTNYKLLDVPITQPSTNPISFAGKVSAMRAQLIHYGACRDGDVSAGYLQGSAFTLALQEAWDKGNFNGNYPQLYDAIKASLKQHGEPQEPQFNLYGNVQPEFLKSRPFSLG